MGKKKQKADYKVEQKRGEIGIVPKLGETELGENGTQRRLNLAKMESEKKKTELAENGTR